MSLNNIAVLVFILICGLQAATVTWNGVSGTAGKWSDAASWDSTTVPTAADDVVINSGGIVDIDTVDGVAANTVSVSSGGLLTITTSLATYQVSNDGTVVVASGGSLKGNESDATAKYIDDSYSSVLMIAGTVEIDVEVPYGEVQIWAGGEAGNVKVGSRAYLAPTAKASKLEVTGTVTFQGPPEDGEAVTVDSLEVTSGDLVLGNGTIVNVTKNFNSTSSTSIRGDGWLNLGEDSVQGWDYVDIRDNVILSNYGWLESGSSYYFIYLYESGVFSNYGSLHVNARIQFYDVTTSLLNWGEIVSDDDGTDSDSCYFYGGSFTDGGSPNVTNYEGANITCTIFRVYYLNVDNRGSINAEAIDLSGNADSTVISINEDQDSLVVTGYGTILFVGDRTIQSLTTDSGTIYFKNQDGNTTINSYNSTSTNYWTSGESSFFIFNGFFETTYYEYLENAWIILEDDTNQTSSAYWYFTSSTVYSRGHFTHSGSSWTMKDENSTFINQGRFDSESGFYIYGDTTSVGAFINVGVVRFVNGITSNVHTAVCNGGLLVLADSEDGYFDSVTVYTYERVALDGSLELEFGPDIAEDKELTGVSLWYYSNSASNYPDEFEDGVPTTFDDESDYDVTVRAPEGDVDFDAHDFKDINSCFTTTGLLGLSKTVSKTGYSCLDQPSDISKGICGERELPEATVDIVSPTTGSASNTIFSVLSVFFIAAFFTLF